MPVCAYTSLERSASKKLQCCKTLTACPTRSKRRAIIISSSYITCVTCCLLPISLYSLPALLINLFLAYFGCYQLFFFFSPHFYSHSLEWHCTPSCSPVMCYPFFSDGNSSRTLSSSFQFQFSALCIKRTQGVLASS